MTTPQAFLLGIAVVLAAIALIWLTASRLCALDDVRDRDREIERLKSDLRAVESRYQDAIRRRDELYEQTKHDEDMKRSFRAGMTLMDAIRDARLSGEPTKIKLLDADYVVLNEPRFPENVELEWENEAPDFYVINPEGIEIVKAVKA